MAENTSCNFLFGGRPIDKRSFLKVEDCTANIIHGSDSYHSKGNSLEIRTKTTHWSIALCFWKLFWALSSIFWHLLNYMISHLITDISDGKNRSWSCTHCKLVCFCLPLLCPFPSSRPRISSQPVKDRPTRVIRICPGFLPTGGSLFQPPWPSAARGGFIYLILVLN